MSFAFPKKERKEPFEAILGGLLIYHRIHSNMYRSKIFQSRLSKGGVLGEILQMQSSC